MLFMKVIFIWNSCLSEMWSVLSETLCMKFALLKLIFKIVQNFFWRFRMSKPKKLIYKQTSISRYNLELKYITLIAFYSTSQDRIYHFKVSQEGVGNDKLNFWYSRWRYTICIFLSTIKQRLKFVIILFLVTTKYKKYVSATLIIFYLVAKKIYF